MCVRSSIDINHCRIFLLRVKANGFHHSVVEVGLSVGSLQCAARVFWDVVALPWVFCCEQSCALSRCGVYEVDVAWSVGCGIFVCHESTRF